MSLGGRAGPGGQAGRGAGPGVGRRAGASVGLRVPGMTGPVLNCARHRWGKS